MKIRPYKERDRQSVLSLWQEAGLVVPHNNPDKDINRKLADSPEWFLIGEEAGEIVSTCMVGYEGHRGWVNYLAVRPELQGTGRGRKMMDAAEDILRSAGCPKINLQVRSTNTSVMEFYKKLGFAVDQVASMGKRLDPD